MQIGVQMKAEIKPQLIFIIYSFGMGRFGCPSMKKNKWCFPAYRNKKRTSFLLTLACKFEKK